MVIVKKKNNNSSRSMRHRRVPCSLLQVWRWMLRAWLTAICIREELSCQVLWAGGALAAPAEPGRCALEPSTRVDCYPPMARFPNASEETCRAQGCCWKPLNNSGIPCAFDATRATESSDRRCRALSSSARMACRNPFFVAPAEDATTCHAMGCCFDHDMGGQSDGVQCFQPFVEGYELLTLEETEDGWRGSLVWHAEAHGPFGNELALLSLHVIRESTARVRIRITDPSFARYEVPDLPVKPDKMDHDQESIGSEASDESGARDGNVSEYKLHFTKRPFAVAVTRRQTGEVLFNSTPPLEREDVFNGLVFENQFIEISTQLQAHSELGEPLLYGLGEKAAGVTSLRLSTEGQHTRHTLFARRQRSDPPTTSAKQRHAEKEHHGKSYSVTDQKDVHKGGGVHPFYLQILDSGHAHGVFFLASNAMEVVTQSSALTFRVTGGVLDFYVFTGPTVRDVTQQYTDVVGRPAMPPLWALGYHLELHGDTSLSASAAVVDKMRTSGLPVDAVWLDVKSENLEVEDKNKDEEEEDDDEEERVEEAQDASFSSRDTLDRFVKDLHLHNQYCIVRQTPTIAVSSTDKGSSRLVAISELHRDNESYERTPLQRGIELDVFVKSTDGQLYAEKMVDSQWSVFVDFFHPNASKFWYELLSDFQDEVATFDGVWIDGNEPTSSCDMALSNENGLCDVMSRDGAYDGRDRNIFSTATAAGRNTVRSFVRSQDMTFPFDPYRQPFTPGQSETMTDHDHQQGNLNAGTLPMAAVHYSSLHYNLHSMYGHKQALVTRGTLDKLIQKRSLLLSRSTFSGDGRFTGHLLSETPDTWEGLRSSITNVLQMNMLGISMVGNSVCGSGGHATKELIIRCHQAVSFFPLVHNHVDTTAKCDHPSVLGDEETTNIIRDTLVRRYKFMPYLYTQLYRAHVHGEAVVSPLMFEFSNESDLADVDTQYLVGVAILVSPVVHHAQIGTTVRFPRGSWYDSETGLALVNQHDTGADRNVHLLTPLPEMQVHVRGGHIIPTQTPALTTAMTRRGAYRLIVALENDTQGVSSAKGELFLDDGDSLNSVEDGRFTLIHFRAVQNASRGSTLELSSKRLVHGYEGPEMHVDLGEIVVLGLRDPFHSNSSITVHDRMYPPTSDVKVDYFSQTQMLVLSRFPRSIGEEFDLDVVASPGKPSSAKENTGRGSRKEHEGETSDGGDHGEDHYYRGHEDGGAREEPHDAEATGKGPQQSFTTWGIVGVIAGALILAGIVAFFIFRQRGGYNAIT